MKKPKLNFSSLIEGLLFAFLILLPFGVLAQLPLSFENLPEIKIYLIDLVLALLLVSWGLGRFLIKKKPYQLPPLALPLFSFTIIALLSLGAAAPLLVKREALIASLYLIRWLAYVGLYLVIADTKKTLFKKTNFLSFLMIIGIFVALFGLIQYCLYPDLKPLETLHWDPHFYRLTATFLDPGFTGLILVLTLIIIFSLSIKAPKKKKRLFFLAGLMVYLVLILTHSRSAYLAFLTGMGLITFLTKKVKVFLMILIFFSLSLMILPQPQGEGGKLTRTYSIRDRFQSWQNALTISQDHPLLGVGFNAYRYAQRDYGFLEEENWQESHSGAGADSSLLFILATTGILGLTAYLWFLTKALTQAFKQRDKTIGLVCLASLGAIIIHSFFLNSLFYPWLMGWLMILLACLEEKKESLGRIKDD